VFFGERRRRGLRSLYGVAGRRKLVRLSGGGSVDEPDVELQVVRKRRDRWKLEEGRREAWAAGGS